MIPFPYSRALLTTRRVAAGANDPYFSDVQLLLHMNGSNGSTTFTDSSSFARTVTAFGNTNISTAQNKFGGASAIFDGSNDYLSIQDSDGFNFAGSNFTVEGWFYESASGVIRQIIGQHSTTGSGTNNSFLLLSDSAKLTFQVFYGLSAVTAANPSTHSLNTWHHYAAVRNGTSTLLFLNGTQVASGSIGSNSLNNSSLPVTIGIVMSGTSPDPGNYCFNGYLDEFRITKGISRYTANFTPPTAQFPDS